MRILYLHQFFALRHFPTGTRSYEHARRLVEKGHDVTMITSSAGLGDEWAPGRGWATHDIDGIHLEVVWVPYANAMSATARVRAFVRFALLSIRHVTRFRADVVYASSTPLSIVFPALVAKWWHRVPLVFEVRDLWPDLPIAVGSLRNPLARAAARLLERIAYRESTHVVVLSPDMRAALERRGVPAAKITEIPNSCDVDLFDVPADSGADIRQTLGLRPGQPLIVYAGTFGRINGVAYLVRIAAAARRIAPEMAFLLVGRGAEAAYVTSEAERLGVLGANLWIWPPLPKSDMPRLMAAATVATSVFVPLEAMWANSANKFFDGLAAGRPVAINYGGWQADLLARSGAGIVLPADAADAAAADLAAFVRDSARVRRAEQAARHLSRSVYSRDAMAERLRQVLETVVPGEARTVTT